MHYYCVGEYRKQTYLNSFPSHFPLATRGIHVVVQADQGFMFLTS